MRVRVVLTQPSLSRREQVGARIVRELPEEKLLREEARR